MVEGWKKVKEVRVEGGKEETEGGREEGKKQEKEGIVGRLEESKRG